MIKEKFNKIKIKKLLKEYNELAQELNTKVNVFKNLYFDLLHSRDLENNVTTKQVKFSNLNNGTLFEKLFDDELTFNYLSEVTPKNDDKNTIAPRGNSFEILEAKNELEKTQNEFFKHFTMKQYNDFKHLELQKRQLIKIEKSKSKIVENYASKNLKKLLDTIKDYNERIENSLNSDNYEVLTKKQVQHFSNIKIETTSILDLKELLKKDFYSSNSKDTENEQTLTF